MLDDAAALPPQRGAVCTHTCTQVVRQVGYPGALNRRPRLPPPPPVVDQAFQPALQRMRRRQERATAGGSPRARPHLPAWTLMLCAVLRCGAGAAHTRGWAPGRLAPPRLYSWRSICLAACWARKADMAQRAHRTCGTGSACGCGSSTVLHACIWQGRPRCPATHCRVCVQAFWRNALHHACSGATAIQEVLRGLGLAWYHR